MAIKILRVESPTFWYVLIVIIVKWAFEGDQLQDLNTIISDKCAIAKDS